MVVVLASLALNALSTAALFSRQSFELFGISVFEVREEGILREGSNRWKVLKQGENLTVSSSFLE